MSRASPWTNPPAGSAAAAITSGTISGATISGSTFSTTSPNTGVVTTLYTGGIPFIGLSTGSVAAGGGISGITNLPAIYPDAYCYFPANALATSIAAGWYYCTFATLSTGTAFLNTYTSGIPTIPSSPTAVTDGKGAFTGDTGEEFGPTITVPALGVNSALRIAMALKGTNNANAKTYRVRLSGNGGTIFIAGSIASLAGASYIASIKNTGSAAKQYSTRDADGGTSPTTIDTLGTVNTAVSTSLVLSLQRATATDNLVLLPPSVELLY